MSDAEVWCPTAPVAELSPGVARGVSVGATALVLCPAGDEVYALAGICTHAGQKLDGGRIRGRYLSCPFHGARFDITTGAGFGLAAHPLQTFAVKIEHGVVFVRPEPLQQPANAKP